MTGGELGSRSVPEQLDGESARYALDKDTIE
jgi:hypothetical protein